MATATPRTADRDNIALTDETRTPGADVQAWLGQIERAERDMDGYRRRCAKIRKRFRYEASREVRKRKFALLWSNTETLKPACYSRQPKPVVENRWKDGDPVADLTSTMLERNLAFQFERCGYDTTFKLVRDDYLLYARGGARFRYEPVWDKNAIAGDSPADDSEDEPPKSSKAKLKFENLRLEYIQPTDLIHPRCRTWPELPWLAFKAFLSRDELVERFGKKLGNKIGLDARTESTDDQREARTAMSSIDKATIFEIWDKTRTKVLWIAKAYKDVLEEIDPYLKVDGFYPMPRPAYGTTTADTLEPVPDYIFYQDQAEEVDTLTARIAALQDALKLVGFYPAGPEGEGAPEVERAMTPGIENKMIAVKSWAVFTDQGKGGAPIVWLPVDQVSKVLQGCVELRKTLVDDTHQITGISDIMRGDTDPDETATAQTKKSNWTSSRLKDRQDEMARYCRDTTRMAGEIISNHFQIDSLMQGANMRLPTQLDERQMQLRYQMAVQQWQQVTQQAQAQGQPR